jgi:hypothetical protein
VCDVHYGRTEDNGQVLIVDAMALKSMMNCRVLYLPDGNSILNMISICGYVNIAWNEMYIEIPGFGSTPARRNYFNWNHFSCVNLRSKVSTIVTSLQHYCVHTQQLSINGSLVGVIEQAYLTFLCCTSLTSIDDSHVEGAVPVLFGLCHRRWTIAPSLLILRFDSGDPLSLSSVKAIQYPQLNLYKPQVHTPDRPLGESTAGHQLVWST